MHSDDPEIDPENFCYFPFRQLLLQPTGVVSPCCWNQGIVLGNVPEQSLGQIWNGEEMQKLRQEFLSGRPVSCTQQMRHIGCHRYSRRRNDPTLELAPVIKSGPRRFDLRLNGKCNLQCVMCDVWRQPNGIYNQSDFWQSGPTEIFPYLEEIDMLGGEPFIQQDTFKLIDMVSAVNSRCTWAFVTNAHYKFGEAIRSRLDKIGIRWLQVSLDSLNAETYAGIRRGGDLSKPLATIENLLIYRKQWMTENRSFRFILSMCVQKQNRFEVPEFLDFALENELEPTLQFAYDPFPISLLGLTEEEKTRVVRFYESLIPHYGCEVINPVLLPLRECLKLAPLSGDE